MKNRIVLHPAFGDDLEEVIDFLQGYGVTSAEEFKQVVYSTLSDPASMPRAGSLKFFRGRELAGLRSWSVRGYRKILILYRPLDDGIDVIALLHGARNIPSILRRRFKRPPHE